MTTALLTKSDPTAHLSDEDIENLGRELDAIREQIIASRGERDAGYIRKVIAGQRKLELGSRAVLLFSLPPARGSPAPSACRSPRSSRTWRSGTT
jgi:NADPH-dependent stearoyl-CoA 9-desaturase